MPARILVFSADGADLDPASPAHVAGLALALDTVLDLL